MQKTNRTAGCLLLESDVHPDEEMLGRRSWQGAKEKAVQLCSSESSRDWQLGRRGCSRLDPASLGAEQGDPHTQKGSWRE